MSLGETPCGWRRLRIPPVEHHGTLTEIIHGYLDGMAPEG